MAETEQPAVRTTIVGGRPPGSGKGIGPVPRGLEVLLKKAAVDEVFRARLLAERGASAGLIGLDLAASERALLAAVPEAQLRDMIAGTRVPEGQRLAFLGNVAALMFAALGLLSCSEEIGPAPAGIPPDLPRPGSATQSAPAPTPVPATPPSPPVSRGIRPDLPGLVPPTSATPATTAQPALPPGPPVTKGIRPDLPE